MYRQIKQTNRQKFKVMKTVYLREKNSGNWEICSKEDHLTKNQNDNKSMCKFNTKKGAEKFWSWIYQSKRVVKAKYRLSQTYFNSFEEFYSFIK
jgi:hypothetical protein